MNDRFFLKAGLVVAVIVGIFVIAGVTEQVGLWSFPNGDEEDREVVANLGESMLNPEGSDVPSGEWVCLLNRSSDEIDMLNWIVHDESKAEFRFPEFSLLPEHEVRLRTGRGRSSHTDLFWNRNAEVWDNAGDTITILGSQREPVWEGTYTFREEPDATGDCGPPLSLSVGILLADFSAQEPTDILVGDTLTDVIPLNEPETCLLRQCLQTDYTLTTSGDEPGGWSLDFFGNTNLAERKSLCVEARGIEGGESFEVDFEDSEGLTASVPATLGVGWTVLDIPLSTFSAIDLRQVSSIDVLFHERDGSGTVYFQTAFVTAEGSCEDTALFIEGDPLLPPSGG